MTVWPTSYMFAPANRYMRCRRNWWLLPLLSKDDKEWMLAESLEAEVQPLVYNHKLSGAQLV
jgi:hypothetical protein